VLNPLSLNDCTIVTRRWQFGNRSVYSTLTYGDRLRVAQTWNYGPEPDDCQMCSPLDAGYGEIRWPSRHPARSSGSTTTFVFGRPSLTNAHIGR
jgi:hypothetical protein